jgi:hypothetical protein
MTAKHNPDDGNQNIKEFQGSGFKFLLGGGPV